MSKIVASPVAVFVAGAALAFALVGGMVALGLVSLEFGTPSSEAASRPLKTAYAFINGTGTILRSRGSVKVKEVAGNSNQYCFDLGFVPKVAVASAYWSNGAWVSTVTKGDGFSLTNCAAPFDDAAVQVHADSVDAAGQVGFNIVFHQ
jgi:hypothetical protein